VLALFAAVVAFSLGLVLASAVAPELPATRAGRRTAMLVCVLTGAAAAAMGVAVVRAIEIAENDEPFAGGASPTELADKLTTGVWQAGGLLAAAAAVHLLAAQRADG
jgi:uncharacterized membrane protein YhiD involved in acid resistance